MVGFPLRLYPPIKGQDSWQARQFVLTGIRTRDRRSTLGRYAARSETRIEVEGSDTLEGAALSQGEVQILWQAQHLRKVWCRYLGRKRINSGCSLRLWPG